MRPLMKKIKIFYTNPFEQDLCPCLCAVHSAQMYFINFRFYSVFSTLINEHEIIRNIKIGKKEFILEKVKENFLCDRTFVLLT